MQKILFITATRIGDAILSSGIVPYLREKYPSARFTVACGGVAAPLFEGIPGLDEIIILHKQPFAGHWRRLWRHAVGTRWTHVVDVRGTALAWLLRADRRSVFRGGHGQRHKVEQMTRLLRADKPLEPALYPLPRHLEQAQRLMPADTPVLALAPMANWVGKQWPQEHFLALATRLTATGAPLARAKIAVFGAPSERGQCQGLLDALPRDQVLDYIGKVDLLGIYACLQRARLFIGNDSGLMHLAAAGGVPTLGLFGPSNHHVYAPWGENTAFVRTPESMLELISHDTYDHRTTGTLMRSLTVDAAWDAACALYGKAYDRAVGAGCRA